ncbi:XkdX family protein [Clostridium tertium]|nr:XkdX family protein [Clostridium tertium]MDB1956526.1 XkdX family protein [Clostridium tertium]MDB1958827.1 XkdX family protein [Clostridium tertium]MDB1962306.1 XkdX family protein [Clostridium tertium]MDB1967550.1 XkdX family protein [Clostridium tertium]
MNWFEKIKRYYDLKRYEDEDVKIFVQAKKINEEQYEEIAGKEYIL